MRAFPPLLVSAFVALSGLTLAQVPPSPLTQAEIQQGYSNRSLLAKTRESATPAELRSVESTAGVQLRREGRAGTRMRVLESPAGSDVTQVIKRLTASGRYEFVEPDFVVRAAATPNDPRFATGEQWALRNLGQSSGKPGADIKAEDGWSIQTNASGVIVAVIDSGIRLTHEDLGPNLWVNSGESGGNRSSNQSDDDANGYIDDVHGINALVNRGTIGNGTPTDAAGHGTAVASVIGARGNNGIGMTGVAWNASLMPLRFLDASGYGLVSDEIECIDYAIARRAQIINASYGSAAFSQAEYDALKRARDAGIIVVCSAGNGGENADLTPHYPSGYLLDNILSVANSTRADELSPLSDYGTGLTEIAAPGTSVLTASPWSNAGYQVVSGTSFSAPMVSGALALLRAKFPADSYRESMNRLLRSVDVLPALTGKTGTGGRLNLAAALRSTSTRPFNDDFAKRAVLVGESVTARSSSAGSTREVGETVHAGTAGSGSLWWTWTAPRGGALTVDTGNSAFDTLLHVYTGTAIDTLTSVASSDDESATINTSKLTFNAVAGTTYQIAVDNKDRTAGGLAVLRLTLLSNNDNFDSAQVVMGRSWQVTADNRNSSRESGEPRIKNNAGGRSIWYRWVAPATRRYHLSAYSDDFDSMIAVYTGTSLSTLAEVNSSLTDGDSNYTLLDAGLTLSATAGTTYYIVVDSEVPSSGQLKTGQFRLSCLDAAWEFFGTGPIGSLTVAPRGTLHGIDPYGYVYSLEADGGRQWRYLMTGYGTTSAPAVAADGTVYAADDQGYVYALTPEGTRKWRIYTRSRIQSSPALAPDGTVYLRSDDGKLHALNPADGTTRWTAATGTSAITTYTSPVVAADGTIYCAGGASRFHAFAPNGTVKWTFDSDFFYASPAIAADGTIYIGVAAPTRRMYALRPDGTLKWEYVVGNTVSSSVAIGVDGTLYFGCADDKLYALSSTGDLRWTFNTGGAIRNSSPVIAGDGSIIVGSLDGKVYWINPEGTLRRTFCTADEVRSSPLLHQGRLYFGSNDYRLYAVDVGQVPASSAWPMHRQNVRRSARVEWPSLAFGVQPAGQTAAVEETVTFVAGAVGAAPLTYQWQFNGQPISGATGPAYRIDSVNHVHGGRYSVRVSDTTGSITSNQATLTISTPLVPPAVLTPPAAQTALMGGAVTFSVVANGSAPLAFQWLHDGVPIAGATNSQLELPSARLANCGRYSVTISNFGGVVTSAASTLTVNPVCRISNLSIRTQVGGDAGTLTVGLTVGGGSSRATKPLLLRAVGPTLGQFGVTGFLADPKLAILSGATAVAQNDDWAGNSAVAGTSVAVGAFALVGSNSKDAALAHSAAPGGYTVQISGTDDSSGVTLVEAYDATPSDDFLLETPRLINVSALTRVGTGSDILIAGFSVTGATEKNVLIRAIGPTLGTFGVGDTLADPKLELYAGETAPLAANDNWSSAANAAQVAAAAAKVGAFALSADSKDAVLLLTLKPGSYTAQISGVDNLTGSALVEIYDIP